MRFSVPFLLSNFLASRVPILMGAVLLSGIIPNVSAETTTGEVTRFSPDEGQPLFPAGNLNVFKQYVLAVDESERVGKRVSIDLLFTSLEFGGEVSAGVKAALGLEVGMCFGGNADFDLAFKPSITVPDRYPTEFPIRLVVDEGLLPDSHFTTTFPPLGKAYADLIFDLGAHLKATACVFGCIDAIDFSFDTCDPRIPSVGGYRMFKESVRCDPALDAEAYCSVELASFNRNDDNTFRMLNVTANNRFEFVDKPYLEFAPSTGTNFTKTFAVNSETNTLVVSGVHRLSNEQQVKVSSTGSLPGGLSSSKIYFVTNLKSAGASQIEFQLATRSGGLGIAISSVGSGEHSISLVETNKPEAPTFGNYGTISINAPTVGTDSRTASINGEEKSFTVNPLNDTVAILSPPGFRNGSKVRISSAGKLPGGLSRGCVYYVTNASQGGLVFQLSTTNGAAPVAIADLGIGTHRIALSAEFNTAKSLKSTGAEDMLSISIDVAKLVSDILLPPTFPSLSDSGSQGPVSWDYTLASLNLGPAVQLKTDFEMTWDLVVTDILFMQPGTVGANATVIVDGVEVSGSYRSKFPAKTVHLTNEGPSPLPGVVLKNTDPVAVTIIYALRPKLKTTVSSPFLGRVKYAALGAGASIDRVGELRFGPLIQGEHVFKAGEFTVFDGDPSEIASAEARTEYELPQDISRYDLLLVDTDTDPLPSDGCALVIVYRSGGVLNIRIFDSTGDRVEDELASTLLSPSSFAALEDQLDPWPIADLNDDDSEAVLESATSIAGNTPGVIKFELQAAGPPSFLWNPQGLEGGNNGFGNYRYWNFIGGDVANPYTNWLELILYEQNPNDPNADDSYPGALGTGSDATIDVTPYPFLYQSVEIASLNVGSSGRLDIYQFAGFDPVNLTVNGGAITNSGTITLNAASSANTDNSYLRLDRQDAILSGTGTLNLDNGMSLRGYPGGQPFTFINENEISGIGIAMDRYGVGGDSKTTNLGAFIASGGSGNGDKLISSAALFINSGELIGETGATLQVKGARLENRPDGLIRAVGNNASVFVQFEEVEQTGFLNASGGGYIGISSGSGNGTTWYGQQLLSDWKPGSGFTSISRGGFLATGFESRINFYDADVIGGFFGMSNGGLVSSTISNFDGSVFQIGDFSTTSINPQSGTLRISGGETTLFKGAYLTNHGTLEIFGEAEFTETMLFANNGTVQVNSSAVLQIRENVGRTADPDASEVAKRQPGMANATGELLVGGTWDIAGTLLIDGATFIGTGANALRTSTNFGSADEGFEPDPVTIEDDLSKVLSLGNPAHVILRGAEAAFPALDSLQQNGGVLELLEGADFPGGEPGSLTAGDLINRGRIIIEAGSVLSVGERYIQTGADTETVVLSGGELISAIGNYQIIGGDFTAESGANVIGLNGGSFRSGTTLRVESPLIDTNETDFTGQEIFIQEKVIVTLGSGIAITAIDPNVDVTIHGGAVQFPALSNNLSFNAGRLTLSGDGIDNSPNIGFGNFTNTAAVNVLGKTTRFSSTDYTQNGSGSSTRVGPGATLSTPDLVINGGELVLEISARPAENQFGKIQSARVNFNNNLVIDFIGEVAESKPDIGDTWPIMNPNQNSRISGESIVDFRWNGGSLPSNWLPMNSRLEVVRLKPKEANDGGILSGLGIQVVPAGGFIEYEDWAVAEGFDRSPTSFLSDPMRDFDNDGINNVYDFLFGYNGGNGMFPGRQAYRLIDADEAGAYYELSYERPSGTGAAYIPYYTRDLKKWYPAGMLITDIVPSEFQQGMERVILQSTFPIPPGSVYFRVTASLYNIDPGLVPENPLNRNGCGSMNNLQPEDLIQDNITPSYEVVFGKELYFRTSGCSEGTVQAYITGDNEGLYVYGGFSGLGRAAVHAGLLEIGQYGILKVTFIEPLPVIDDPNTSSWEWEQNGVSADPIPAPTEANPYSFFMELISVEGD
ncbi:hypothetical protein G0Q06_07090 [Puniceicoccales bacterium CK1056]|uniref:Uncharacterized protein n=1 Tax=Oceanipulchritudo coccoides TaxID=2706888 RepID=A0A6B2M2A3_9BACT|nr:hypothetical protein [Oceanipulchritudo coccoides]NDV62207.1 hypothetical protein [Oceanipulchritudo coccoides]